MSNKQTKYYQLIDNSIQKLWEIHSNSEPHKEEIDKILLDVSRAAETYGTNRKNINRLLDIVLSTENKKTFPDRHKKVIVRKWLFSYDSLDDETVTKIIAGVGIQSPHFKENTQLKKISSPVQAVLIRWLFLNFVHVENHDLLAKLLPMMFNLLAVESIRMYAVLLLIATLLFAANSNEDFSILRFLRPWRIDLLVDLYEKSENDTGLAVLLSFVARQLETSNSAHLVWHHKLSVLIGRFKGSCKLANLLDSKYMSSLISQKIERARFLKNGNIPIETLIETNDELFLMSKNLNELQRLLQSLQSFFSQERLHKRPHVSNEDFSVLKYLVASRPEGTFANVFSNDQFVGCIESLKLPNQIGQALMVRPFTEVRQDDIVARFARTSLMQSFKFPQFLFLLRSDSEKLSELSNWLELVICDQNCIFVNRENCSTLNSLLSQVADFCELSQTRLSFLDRIARLDIELVFSDELEKGQHFPAAKFLNYWRLLRVLSPMDWSKLQEILEKLKFLFTNGDRSSINNLLDALVGMFHNWITSSGPDSELYFCINKAYEWVVNQTSQDPSTPNLYMLFKFYQLLYGLDYANISVCNLVFPASIVQSCVFSSDALLVNLMCRHLWFCKQFFIQYFSSKLHQLGADQQQPSKDYDKMAADLVEFKNLHNSYVMDVCNLLWRNKAFESDLNSTAKAFYFYPEYTNNLLKIGHFSRGDEDQESTVFQNRDLFTLFNMPCFVSAATECIRKVEGDCSEKLIGPLNESKFYKLLQTGEWVNPESFTEYDDLRVDVLRKMANQGYSGVADLLLHSLKSLLSRSQNS